MVELDQPIKPQPFLRWAGGKRKLVETLVRSFPIGFIKSTGNFYEPFVGGGAVYTAVQADNYFINDKSDELISLYRSITNGDRQVFFKAVDEIIHNWDLLTTVIQDNSNFFITTYKFLKNFFSIIKTINYHIFMF